MLLRAFRAFHSALPFVVGVSWVGHPIVTYFPFLSIDRSDAYPLVLPSARVLIHHSSLGCWEEERKQKRWNVARPCNDELILLVAILKVSWVILDWTTFGNWGKFVTLVKPLILLQSRSRLQIVGWTLSRWRNKNEICFPMGTKRWNFIRWCPADDRDNMEASIYLAKIVWKYYRESWNINFCFSFWSL